MTDKRELTRVHLESEWLGGDYVAETWRVSSKLTDNTHRQLVNDVLETWPELFQLRQQDRKVRGSYDKHGNVKRDPRAVRYVRSLPSYVLAVILTQL